jgi:hypothetical protein
LLGRLGNDNDDESYTSAPFPPGVRGIVDQVDRDCLYDRDNSSKLKELADSFRKASAAIFTLGTGCSLGPEGPGVGTLTRGLFIFSFIARVVNPLTNPLNFIACVSLLRVYLHTLTSFSLNCLFSYNCCRDRNRGESSLGDGLATRT